MKEPNKTVFIVDDNSEICEAMRWLFESVSFNVESYNSAQEFLDNYNANQGCLIVDVRMPEMSGLELLEYLKVQKNKLPTIIITGYGDIPMAVRAMKAGAVDFILKPFNEQCLLEAVQKYIHQYSNNTVHTAIEERASHLSEREHQIISLILEGKLNKEIAYDLSISMSTVEAHRANIMRKMGAKNIAQLIKLYLQSQNKLEFQDV